jgi:hypothetical protein
MEEHPQMLDSTHTSWLERYSFIFAITCCIITFTYGITKQQAIPIVFASSAAVYGNNEILLTFSRMSDLSYQELGIHAEIPLETGLKLLVRKGSK